MGKMQRAALYCGFLVFACNASATTNDTGNRIIKSHAVAMHGEVKYPVSFTHFDYANPAAAKGGKVRRSNIGTFDSLNPFIAKGNADSNIGMIYETLMTQSGDEAYSVYGLVAESVEYPEDRSWIIFHLNPNARFHDGHQVDADDIVFSFNTLMEKGAPQYKQLYEGIESVSALNAQAVKFNFKGSDNKELVLTVAGIPVLPEHYWVDREFDKSSLDIPLGSGPYRVKDMDPGRHITYQRVKNYWSKDLPVNRGHYNFDDIRFDYYRDRNIELEAFKAGEYDFRVEYTSKSWATEYTGSKFDSGEIIKRKVQDQSPQGIQAFILNTRRKPFDDIIMRKAMLLAFDFEWSNSRLFYGAYTRSKSYFTNSELAATGLPTGRELEILTPFKDQLPSAVFTDIYSVPVTDGTGRDRHNLIEAQRILKQAGYQIIDSQLHDPGSKKPISVEFLTYSPQFERIINPYIKNLKKLGIKATLRIVDTSQYINRGRSFDFDITTVRRPQTQSPGNEQRLMWTTEAANTEGSGNYSGIKNPVIDQLVELIITAPERTELIHRTRALDRVLQHYNFVVPQWFNDSHRIAYWNIFEYPEKEVPFDVSFNANFATWWLKSATISD